MTDPIELLNHVLSDMVTDPRVESNGLLNQIQHNFEAAWLENQN